MRAWCRKLHGNGGQSGAGDRSSSLWTSSTYRKRIDVAGIAAPWLMVAGEDEARIYARAGFVTLREVLHISRP
jgi:hypothetical protein